MVGNHAGQCRPQACDDALVQLATLGWIKLVIGEGRAIRIAYQVEDGGSERGGTIGPDEIDDDMTLGLECSGRVRFDVALPGLIGHCKGGGRRELGGTVAAVSDRASSTLLARVVEQGWAVVPLLEPNEVAELTSAYRELELGDPQGCAPTTIHPSPAVRAAARDGIRRVLVPAVRRLLPDYRCVVAAFVPKGVGPPSAMALHRDWSTCDEERFLSVEVWAPLGAAGRNDGGLVALAGSHRSAPPRRGSGMALDEVAPGQRPEPGPVEPTLVVASPGDVVVFHPGLLHGSGPNLGPGPRLAVISTFQPADAPLRHYSRRIDGTEVGFEVGEDHYLSDFGPADPDPGPTVES